MYGAARGAADFRILDGPPAGRYAAGMAKAPAKRSARPRVYELKVALRGTEPPIWRRFRLRDDVTLLKLHEMLQVIMGWTDSHLHQFIFHGTYYGRPDPDLPGPRRDERKVRLGDVLKKPRDRLTYEYDFGDSWDHELILEQVLPHEPRARYPVILAGKGACPPEDCGGIPGYYRLLEALAHPTDPERQELLEWVGGKFDPECFDVGALNRALHGGWYLPDENTQSRAPASGEHSRPGMSGRRRRS